MLTVERQNIILNILKMKETVSIQELVAETNTSESTIRRDIIQLEDKKLLKRVHGGAARLQGTIKEANLHEKSNQNLSGKDQIARYAASLPGAGECIYLDAGTTTLQMIQYLPLDIVVVTNGVTHIEPLLARGIKTYLAGGFVKGSTGAMIGNGALYGISKYRFDKCFLGVNGIHPIYGFTTPDPEEASMKQQALKLSREAYVLADDSKWGEIAFALISPLSEAVIITNDIDAEMMLEYEAKTELKVVKSK
ncbi:DeoR/GlpR family DNA-binding transcription regulator [Heyndrickxia acidicola]|uniref:DeoR/GlpR family DNA-binding transcription regulator n=1 Tax=Heyndrickxia acidicola TaxID=209389 RepID=A0ABU6MIU6_9BACI|nr:DeoR/GlpR family DNA-binding transcription regulator [Heyndrickxia acidicola]MED1204318.1 DeoR/GlpR family DNA-binding transcription regulator [Heyndrickxia acidicola]